MSRLFSHINTAKAILRLYEGDVPFTVFLKNFFSEEKKYGSRDRRTIASLCYNYFRTGPVTKNESMERRFLASLFLYSDEPNELLQNEKPEWNHKTSLPLDEKLELAEINADAIFPFNSPLSAGISTKDFNFSFLIQPELFARIRPGKQGIVKTKLAEAKLPFNEVNESCFAFANGTKLEQVLQINRDVVIQDLNSQRVGELFPVAELQDASTVWDCCAASGGKSIMAYDLLPKIKLTVSDVRQSIIQNLQSRFKEAGITGYRSFVADVTNKEKLEAAIGQSHYDLVICDAPCSGSGTWSRTPEQLTFFKEEEILRYSRLQKTIASNAVRYIKEGGYLLYITCSVFKEENEEVVQFLERDFEVTLIKQQLFAGYSIKADTMFAALLQFK